MNTCPYNCAGAKSLHRICTIGMNWMSLCKVLLLSCVSEDTGKRSHITFRHGKPERISSRKHGNPLPELTFQWWCARTPVEVPRTRCFLFAVLPYCLCWVCQPLFLFRLKALVRIALRPHPPQSSQSRHRHRPSRVQVYRPAYAPGVNNGARPRSKIYDHRYEGYVGAGYLRFTPGATLQRVNEYNWHAAYPLF